MFFLTTSFLLVSILALPSIGNANEFNNFVRESSKSELQFMLDRIDARIFVVENLAELHQEAMNGRRPKYLESDLLTLINSIEDSSTQHNALLHEVSLQTPECSRFYRVDRENSARLLQRLKEAMAGSGDISPIIEAQIKILFLQNQQQHGLSSIGADGGMSLIMKQPVSCESVNPIRSRLNEIRIQRIQNIISFIALRFGQDGLRSGFNLTNRLGEMAHKQLKNERKHMVTEFVALSAIAFVGIEIGLIRGLGYLVKLGKLTSRASKLIKGTTFLLLSGYGAIVTVDLMEPILKKKVPKISMGDWKAALDWFDGYLMDEPTRPELLNPLIAEIQVAHHKQTGHSLKKIYDSYTQSIREWGDKDSALIEYKRKRALLLDGLSQIK